MNKINEKDIYTRGKITKPKKNQETRYHFKPLNESLPSTTQIIFLSYYLKSQLDIKKKLMT